MKKAFAEMVAEHSVVKDVLNVLGSITDPFEQKLFMRLFPAEYKVNSKLINTMDLLWNKELDSFAGLSVREAQKQRLITFFGSLDKDQQEKSFQVSNFWVLLENQPEAAVEGLSPELYTNISNYLLNHDQLRITSFANKVISKIQQGEIDPEKMVQIFVPLKRLAKVDSAMEKTLNMKKSAFQIKHAKNPQMAGWKDLLK